MGALISFELTREFSKIGQNMPQHLFMSGFRAPQLPKSDLPIHRLPDEQFLEALSRFQGTPEAVLNNAELMAVFLPILRADFKLLETYFYPQDQPLNCPITALGCYDDPKVSITELEQWKNQTSQAFSLQLFQGGHFFVNQQTQAIVKLISETLLNFPVEISA
jgi:surfactin synthase thioesterase subunit